jgi:hypothetical protein
MAEEDSAILNHALPVSVIRTADENPTDLNSTMATAVLRDEPSRSHCFLSCEQIHQIVMLRDVKHMSWGQKGVKLHLQRSTVQVEEDKRLRFEWYQFE